RGVQFISRRSAVELHHHHTLILPACWPVERGLDATANHHYRRWNRRHHPGQFIGRKITPRDY
ncbi:hypothetical protein ACTVM6_20485, partial [Serratia bockelmannii]|uniref:hypothetical protein n=1 Tax=Serratia bockelmannii TaxID=2703793 RepID=UPI003FA7DCE4